MAVATITTSIQTITGVGSANTDYIASAQKFVASSVPKNLLKWAASETVSSTHGGDNSPTAITLPVGTDNIIAVRRDANDATESSLEDRAWLESSSGSLKVPTELFPKYYITAGNQVRVKPDPTALKTAHVTYVDYSKIDDDSDLRNGVIYHASSKEFTALALRTEPNVQGGNDELTDIDTGAIGADQTDVSKWWDVAGDFIEANEDTELAAAHLQKISIYLQAYGAELAKVNAKAAHYLQLAEKYYTWAINEVKSYVTNNSKTFDKALMAQAMSGGGYDRRGQ